MALIEQDAASARMAERFRQYALEGGFPVVAEDGETILQPRRSPGEAAVEDEQDEAEREVEPIGQEVDLGADTEPRLIHITTRDRKRHTLEVLITVSSARMQSWYLMRMAALRAKLAACEDKTEAKELAARIGEYQYEQTQLSVPNLPPDLLGNLSTAKFEQLVATINQMLEADQLATSPKGTTARS